MLWEGIMEQIRSFTIISRVQNTSLERSKRYCIDLSIDPCQASNSKSIGQTNLEIGS